MLQQNPQSFPTEGFSKTNTPYLCLFLRVCSGYGSFVCVVPDWSADQSDFTYVAVRAGMCAAATEYNQDLEHDVLSLCTPLDVTFLLFSSSSVFASKMHTSVLPRPQCLLALIFANMN